MHVLRWLSLVTLVAVSATGATAGPREVLLIGDSITQGMVSGDGGLPYAEVLAELLGPDYDVINAGCGGASSLDWTLSQPDVICGGVGILEPGLFEAHAEPHLPSDLAVVLLGTNDASGFFEPIPVEVPSYAAAMNEIVWNLLVAPTRHVILMTAPDHDWEDPDRVARLAGYRDEILALCDSHPRIACGPDLHQLLDLGVHFAPGDVHPNADGHATIATELAEVVTDVTAPASCGLGGEIALLLPALMAVRRRRLPPS
ncbi:MAG: SGNH/GDSL hydrolase family protein [Myxococcota bacterium]